MISFQELHANVQKVNERINRACKRAGRKPWEITVVAVTKTHSADLWKMLPSVRIHDIGENRVQEAESKILQTHSLQFTYHMIGHLQRNKVKKALQLFDMIQSLDSVKLAREISKHIGIKRIPLLLEVNTSGEESKYGFRPEEIDDALSEIIQLPGLFIKGLMTVGPLTEDKERIREAFKILFREFERLGKYNSDRMEMKYLSMGMTDDFEIAIEEGANMLRIGRALFGERNKEV